MYGISVKLEFETIKRGIWITEEKQYEIAFKNNGSNNLYNVEKVMRYALNSVSQDTFNLDIMIVEDNHTTTDWLRVISAIDRIQYRKAKGSHFEVLENVMKEGYWKSSIRKFVQERFKELSQKDKASA